MPIEIKELHIKIAVDEGNSSNGRQNKSSTNNQKIISECVEQVMELLRDQKER